MNAGFYFPKNFNQMAEMNASGKQPEESDFFWNLGNPEELKASKCRSSAKVCRKMGVKKDIKKLYMGIFALVLVAIGIFFLLTGGVPMVNVNITIISSGTAGAGNASTSVSPLVARSYMDNYKLGRVDVSNLPAPSAASADTDDGSSNTTLTATVTSTDTTTLIASESTSTVSVTSACGAVSVITITIVSTADAISETDTGTPLTATSGSATSSSLTSDSATSSSTTSTTSDSTTSLSTSTRPSIVPIFSNTTTTTTVIVGTESPSGFSSGTGIILPSLNNTWVQPIPSAHITAISSSTEAAGMTKATGDKKARTGTTVSYCLVMAVMYTVLGIF